MDVNGLPFRLIAGAADFGFAADAEGARIADGLAFDPGSGNLYLASQQEAPRPREDETFARLMASSPAPVADPLGGFAWWQPLPPEMEADHGVIRLSGFAAGSVDLKLTIAPVGETVPSDMMLDADDVLWVARGGRVVLHDLRDRWPDQELAHATLRADLLAPSPSGGGWAFDKARRRLMRLRGVPLRDFGGDGDGAARFAPLEPNRDPPRLVAVPRGTIPGGFTAISLAASAQGKLALLAWQSGADAALFLFGAQGFVEHGRLAGLRFPYALAWDGEDRVAVMAAEGAAPARQAWCYAIAGAPAAHRPLLPDGRVFPLPQAWAGKWCNAAGLRARHLQAATPEGLPDAVRPLHALSIGRNARSGRVLIGPIDGQAAGTVWHRIYAEAALADGTAIDLQLSASDQRGDPALPADLADPAWALHRLVPQGQGDNPPGTPIAAWLAQPSEVPHAPPLLSCPPQPGKAGLFTVLVQQPGQQVRRLTGRYLWIVVTLRGDSQATPELAALRCYAHRLSWRDRYLPDFYGETLSGSDAAEIGAATPHDFMERMLHAHEGVLTEIEGRIAASWQMTDPATAPSAALPWIGQWLGIAQRKGEAPERMRQRLLTAPYTAALGGTCGGLLAALELASGGKLLTGGRIDRGRRVPAPGELAVVRAGDVALRGLMLALNPEGQGLFLTGGGVTRGDIVVVEGFRLRRTFATILGADLADEADPLTLGMATSGNSHVGDTLILGDAARDELLALYAPEIDAARGDRDAVAAFYARLAWRVLVLVRGVDDRAELRRLADVVAESVPAHVEPQVHQARSPLIVGAASLVGIDTYLAEPEPFQRVKLGETALGAGDFVAGTGMLDPRADGPVPSSPVAAAQGPHSVWVGNAFTLSALASKPGGGGPINRYVWMWDKEP